MTSIERHSLVVGIRPEKREEYLALHSAVWPQVEATITAANITNYTIFVHGDLLIAYYEYVGVDHAADLARIGEDPVTREWWTLTDPCQDPLPGAAPGQLWADAREIWHLS